MANNNDKAQSCITTKSLRQLKVYSFIYFNKTHTRAVPWVQLKGRWLEQASFNIHYQVDVEIDNGRLVITTRKDG